MHHRYQQHRRQIFTPFLLALLIPVANLPPVSMIPAANLPPVSTTPVANNGNNIRLPLQTPYSELEGKIYIYVYSKPKVSKQNHINCSAWRFFPFATGVVDTGGKPLSGKYLHEFFEKIWNNPNGIIRGLGETDSRKKTRSKKSRDTVPLTTVKYAWCVAGSQ